MKEKLQEYALLAEIISAICIVLSLIFVGISLRENTLVLQSTTRQEFAAQDHSFLNSALDTSIVAVALSKQTSGEELSELEFSQLVHRQHLNFRIFENALYQYQLGTLSIGEWERYEQILKFVICNDAAAQEMWEIFGTLFIKEFQNIIKTSKSECTP